MNHILLFDIGKTNKKCFVFDEEYRIIFKKNINIPETADEDGYPCEDLNALKDWITSSVQEILNNPHFRIRAINCTTYGASFVHVDQQLLPVTPLYNYLKPFPDDLKKRFFDTFGEDTTIALATASPVLGYLNSGLQLYGLQQRQPLIFNKIKYSLHLPQYISLLIMNIIKDSEMANITDTKGLSADITSIGCHTMLWNFQQNDYHNWVKTTGIVGKFPAIQPSNTTCLTRNSGLNSTEDNSGIYTGIGLHDSSAALIPYLANFDEPFVLLSTCTWCISLNPFNEEPLTAEELSKNCLCYLTYTGKPVKAARYFGGNEHDEAVKKMAAAFGVQEDFYRSPQFSEHAVLFETYRAFMETMMTKQVISTRLAIGHSTVRRIFVDGGFSKNDLYMKLLAAAFPNMEVYAAEIAQATALGAALAIHAVWNTMSFPQNLIALRKIVL